MLLTEFKDLTLILKASTSPLLSTRYKIKARSSSQPLRKMVQQRMSISPGLLFGDTTESELNKAVSLKELHLKWTPTKGTCLFSKLDTTNQTQRQSSNHSEMLFWVTVPRLCEKGEQELLWEVLTWKRPHPEDKRGAKQQSKLMGDRGGNTRCNSENCWGWMCSCPIFHFMVTNSVGYTSSFSSINPRTIENSYVLYYKSVIKIQNWESIRKLISKDIIF